MRVTRDINGNEVRVGSKVRIVSIDPEILSSLADPEAENVAAMLGQVFEVYEVDDYGYAHVDNGWQFGSYIYESHSLTLSGSEMELVKDTGDRPGPQTAGRLASPSSGYMYPKYFEEQVCFVTLKIEASDPVTDTATAGTGFMVQYPVSEDKSAVLLVTCKHVLFDGAGHVTLTFNRRETADSSLSMLGNNLMLGPATCHDVYTGHTDPEIDIAVVDISSIIGNNPLIYYKTLAESNWADFTDEKLIPVQDAFFVGYPTGLYDQFNHLPVASAAKTASHPRVDFNGKPAYLIGAPVSPGCSGSPVFIRQHDGYRFSGMVGKPVARPAADEQQPQALRNFTGPGFVYKPNVVLDVIKLAAGKISGRAD
ncbi:MAG: trypsin-like peptidase domain-containing protein [Gammaproteobacteria bacterium]